MRPTILVLTFNETLDPLTARNPANYRLTLKGHHRPLRIRSAVLSPDGEAVTLHPSRRLPLRFAYRLTVLGTPPSGVTSTSGVYLNAAGPGQAGSDFTTTITRMNLVIPPERHSPALAACHLNATQSIPHGPAAFRHRAHT